MTAAQRFLDKRQAPPIGVQVAQVTHRRACARQADNERKRLPHETLMAIMVGAMLAKRADPIDSIVNRSQP
ncbi:hypothetical protein [Bradyrhizobium sp. th.b2]|uniref:hypothetical protein n=1 Tax=Bradyrhizobium sp. th-b2 TaxID=172088 RepID=UPI0004230118|nr:hypothetical protein [Bradyrhizobium sp. th.b2]